MPFELQQVKRRIGTARQIRKVTSAMQRVAAARLLHDRRSLEASRRYTERLNEVLADVCGERAALDHPLLQPNPGAARTGLVIFGSERGLCGGFNSRLMEALNAFAANRPRDRLDVVAVGKIVNRRTRRMKINVMLYVPQPSRERRAEPLDRVADSVVRAFTAGTHAEFHALYLRFVSPLRQDPAVVRLLPAPFPSGEAPRRSGWPLLEPDAGALLDHLLPHFVRQALDFGFLNSSASENACRQTAMTRATENAGDMLRDLMVDYRRLRQETITNEMLELIGGMSGQTTRAS